MALTFALLTLAILSLWIGTDETSTGWRLAWIVPFSAALVAAIAAHIIEPVGLVWIALLALAGGGFSSPKSSAPMRGAFAFAIIVLAGGLMAHQLPGFNNPRTISGLRFSAEGIPYRLHLNFDKTTAGLLLLAFCHARIGRARDWQTMFRRTAPAALATIIVLLTLALAFGYVRFDAKFPPHAWQWMWVNLCFTCMAEEALFRGFIQAQLQKTWQHIPRGKFLALATAAVLFGLAHAGGGMTYVALSTVAGFGYGWAYLRTGRIEASILAHFALNAVHFFGFTYPALEHTR